METLIFVFTSPYIQLFILGLLAGYFKSDLELPQAFTKALSIYLMLAIGMKGGVEIANSTVPFTEIILVLGFAFLLSLLIPFLSFFFLRKTTELSRLDSAAIAAHYGSVSAVTFSFGMAVLNDKGIPFEGYVVTVLAIMEFPAILSGLLLAKKSERLAKDSKQKMLSSKILREVFLNGSIVLLIGGMIVGMTANEVAMAKVKPYLIDPFFGVLCLFLLELGLVCAKQVREAKGFSFKLFAFGIYMPIIASTITMFFCVLLGFDLGVSILLVTLAASASYIAVPAAMKIALPDANPAYYITLSLCITFPFNLLIGIPVYTYFAQMLIG